MNVRAFILVQTEIGFSTTVAAQCKKLPNLVSVDLVTGPYDVVVVVDCTSIQQLGQEIVSEVQQIDGVTRTLTCPSVHLIEGLGTQE